VFPTKRKKEEQKNKNKSNQNQNHENGKESHEHYTIFMVQNHLALLAFQDEGCMHLHPKNHVHKYIDFSVYTNFPNLMSYLLRMRGPLKESTSCFLIRLSPLVLVPIGLFHMIQSPAFYHS